MSMSNHKGLLAVLVLMLLAHLSACSNDPRIGTCVEDAEKCVEILKTVVPKQWEVFTVTGYMTNDKGTVMFYQGTMVYHRMAAAKDVFGQIHYYQLDRGLPKEVAIIDNWWPTKKVP